MISRAKKEIRKRFARLKAVGGDTGTRPPKSGYVVPKEDQTRALDEALGLPEPKKKPQPKKKPRRRR